MADEEGPNLMGRDWMNKLNVSQMGIYNLVGSKDSNLEETLGKYAKGDLGRF